VNEYTIDPVTWFTERELKHTPKHFIISKTPLTVDGKIWILNKLKGRFSITFAEDANAMDDFLVFHSMGNPAFEDPKEAIFYELTWS
jgi:hypothetical protein